MKHHAAMPIKLSEIAFKKWMLLIQAIKDYPFLQWYFWNTAHNQTICDCTKDKHAQIS